MEVSKTTIKQGTDPLSVIGKQKKIKKEVIQKLNDDKCADSIENGIGNNVNLKSNITDNVFDNISKYDKTTLLNEIDEIRSSNTNLNTNTTSNYFNSEDNYIASQVEVKRGNSNSNTSKNNKKTSNNNLNNNEIVVNNTNTSSSSSNNLFFLPSEAILECVTAYIYKEGKEYLGKLYLTEFQIVFQISDFFKYKNKNKIKELNETFKAYYFTVNKLEKQTDKGNSNGDKYIINITFNTGILWKLIILSRDLKAYFELVSKVYPKDYNGFFSYSKSYSKLMKEKSKQNCQKEINGWNIYSQQKEIVRQGVNLNKEFRITTANKSFALCKTYPEILVVPTEVNDNILFDAATFRTKNRLPALSYYNHRLCKGTLWRCSQPKSGITNNRNKNDEKLLRSIKSISGNSIIYDARPYINAMANRVKGGGTEISDNYDNVKLVFCDIDNIHGVSESWYKMFQLNKSDDNIKYYSQLENTNWLEFQYKILKHSKDIVKHFLNDYSVIIHCSDGWDRSSQLLAVSQILIDPYFRTGSGFATLIEKEFLSFGHQFGLRSGIKVTNQDEEQKSPVFIQFLDTIYQLICQFPQAFEFNEELLLFLAKHYHSLLYGTFLFNSELHRKDNKANQISRSIWTDVFEYKESIISKNDDIFNEFTLKDEYINKNYDKDKYSNSNFIKENNKFKSKSESKFFKGVLHPHYGVKMLNVWEKYFNTHSIVLDKIISGEYFNELNQEEDVEEENLEKESSDIINPTSTSFLYKTTFSFGLNIIKEIVNIDDVDNNFDGPPNLLIEEEVKVLKEDEKKDDEEEKEATVMTESIAESDLL